LVNSVSMRAEVALRSSREKSAVKAANLAAVSEGATARSPSAAATPRSPALRCWDPSADTSAEEAAGGAGEAPQ
jgi:hypothetical protein